MGRENGNHQENMLNNLYYRYLAFRPALMHKDLKMLNKLKIQGKELPKASKTGWARQDRSLTPGGGPWQWFFHVTPVNGSGFYGGRTHNTMLNTDIGLFLDFDTLTGGAAVAPDSQRCQFLPQTSNGAPTIRMQLADVDTCRQSYTSGDDANDGLSMADIVEEYADNQNKWLTDFNAALMKMLANGQGELSNPL